MAHTVLAPRKEGPNAAVFVAAGSVTGWKRGRAMGGAGGGRQCCGAALGLDRLMRTLRKQGRMLRLAFATSTRPSARSASSSCQYDPTSYARNFDSSGFGASAGLEASDNGNGDVDPLHYMFTSRFVLAPVIGENMKEH